MELDENIIDKSTDGSEEKWFDFKQAKLDGKSHRISKVINGIHIPIGQRAKFDDRKELFQQIHPDRPYYLRIDYSFGFEKLVDVVFIHTFDLVKVNKPL